MQKLILIAVLVAGLSALVIPKQKQGVYTTEMKRGPSLRAKLIKEGKWAATLNDLRIKSNGNQPITDYYDDFYLANVTSGTPPQGPFLIVPDTGSSNYWLISSSCNSAACRGQGRTKNRFDPSKSSTYSAQPGTPFSIQYGSGSCSGTIVTDILQFAGLSVPKQQFGLATTIASVFGQQPVDGIMGLGWPALAVDNVVPPMQNLLSTLDKPLFTFWLDRRVPIDMGDANGGLITWGAIDATNCDATVNYVTLSSKTYWQFAMDAISTGSWSSTKSQQVISDTGTSWLAGPQAQVDAIAQAIGATMDPFEGIYTISCTATAPDIVLTIGGMKYNIPSTEYILDLELGGGNCAVTMQAFSFGGIGPQWILGDTFIRTYCNIYDIGGGRIGFAKAHHTQI